MSLNILTVKCYSKLLRKVKIDSYVRKIWLLKIWKNTQLKRRKHAAATYCALYKHRGRYKDSVETSRGRCEDVVYGLDWSYSIWCFFYLCNDFLYHLWHGEMNIHLLHGPRMPAVKITTFSDQFHTRVGFAKTLLTVMLYPPSMSSFVHACTNISKATIKIWDIDHLSYDILQTKIAQANRMNRIEST